MAVATRSDQTLTTQGKTFHSGLTRDFGVLAGILFLVGLGVMESGSLVETYVSRKGVYLMWVGGAILASILVILYNITGSFIIVTAEEITHQGRWGRVTIPWTETSDFHEPLMGSGYFRKCHVGNEVRCISFSSLSFAKFDTIVALIRVGRRRKYHNVDAFCL